MNTFLSHTLQKTLLNSQQFFNKTKQKVLLSFCLFHKQNELFILNGYTKYNIFSTPFFIIKTINIKKNCAVLEPLIPCFNTHTNCNNSNHNFCCVKKLFRTTTQITINLSYFYGFFICDIPIFDYLLQHKIFKQTFCISYVLFPSMPSSIIWKTSTSNIFNTATITFFYQSGLDSQIKITVHTKTDSFTVYILQKQCYSITTKDLTHIKIHTPHTQIYGAINIQLHTQLQKKLYF
ncbi:CotZ-related putative spore coat protein [Bacillus mycoides]|uniref:CotZ-related putative spore coat protein n=1 Tax=Bacillus mycoides TaxID=1405 RepID=UPI003D235591